MTTAPELTTAQKRANADKYLAARRGATPKAAAPKAAAPKAAATKAAAPKAAAPKPGAAFKRPSPRMVKQSETGKIWEKHHAQKGDSK